MTAHPQQADGYFPGNLVQVGPGGHTALGQGLLVPAHTQQVGGSRPGQLRLPPLNHCLNGGHAHQGQAVPEEGVEKQVHVGIGKAGEHLPSLQVDFLVPGEGQGILVAAHKDDGAVLGADGLLPGLTGDHGVHLAVIPKSAHEKPSIF